MFVDGKECGRELTEVDLEAKNSEIRLSSLRMQPGSSLLFSTRAEIEARPSDMASEDIEKQMMN